MAMGKKRDAEQDGGLNALPRVSHLRRCYGCRVVNGQSGVFFIFMIDDFSAPRSALETGMGHGV